MSACPEPLERDEDPLARLRALSGGGPPAGPLVLRGASLVGEDLRGLDLSHADLTEADLTEADLSGARLIGARLGHACLVRARLTGAELAGADLRLANLEGATCARAGLGMARLDQARLFDARLEHATLTRASLRGADLRCADLGGARLRESDLRGADLTGARLYDADLSRSRVDGAVLDDADLRESRLRQLEGFERASWIGADIRDINFAGAYRLRRFVADQNYLKEFRDRGRLARLLYYLWWATSDCGESVLRWFAWILALTLAFAWIYTFVGVEFGSHPGFLAALYFSVVTMTTLGYGDILPVSDAARAVAIIQVLTGYMMLGGLLTIFNNKMARRGE